jgi:hypothetical protein
LTAFLLVDSSAQAQGIGTPATTSAFSVENAPVPSKVLKSNKMPKKYIYGAMNVCLSKKKVDSEDRNVVGASVQAWYCRGAAHDYESAGELAEAALYYNRACRLGDLQVCEQRGYLADARRIAKQECDNDHAYGCRWLADEARKAGDIATANSYKEMESDARQSARESREQQAAFDAMKPHWGEVVAGALQQSTTDLAAQQEQIREQQARIMEAANNRSASPSAASNAGNYPATNPPSFTPPPPAGNTRGYPVSGNSPATSPAAAAAPPPAADTRRSPVSGSCITEFLDPKMYNWLALRNTCSESLYLMWLPKTGRGPDGAWTLSPGATTSTGYSRQEVDAKGGFQFYICPAGFVPVDSGGAYVQRLNTSYWCKKQ